MDPWDIAAMRAAASRERSEVMHALLAQFAAWLRSVPTIRARQETRRECLGTGC
jgi:hypothetical protein